MLRVKNNAKFLVAFGIMLVAMFIFNINTVNAVEPTQEMLDLIPNEITLDISEIECVETDTKAQKLIEQKIREIYQQNSIDTNEMQVRINGARFVERDIRTADVTITNKNGGNPKSKKVSVVYSNTNQKNSTDEQYVKNLMNKITDTDRYYEIDINSINNILNSDIDPTLEKFCNIVKEFYINSINDNTVLVKIAMRSGGDPINSSYRLCFGIFKNGILYGIKDIQATVMPVINIPNTVSANNINDYAINLIKKHLKEMGAEEFGNNITKIEKGAKFFNKTEIPNGYTIYSNSGEELGWVILKGNINNDTTTSDVKPVAVTDNKTNIKLETNDGVVPSNTVLEVQPITEGKIFDNVKKVLSNVNKFKAFDITLKSNGVEIQPNGKVKISIPIPQDFDTSKLMVYRVEENGQKVAYKVNVVTIDNVKYAQFETDHFSTYVLAETDPNSNEKDNTPKTGIETNTIPYVLGIVATIGIAFIIKRK